MLRTEVLNGLFEPGQKMKLLDLSARFGVSQSAVREALTRLAEQNLVVATPQRGFRVRELSITDIAQLTEARVQIESLALRLSIERGDVHWETRVLAAHHLLDRTAVADATGTVTEEWPIQHMAFHEALLAGCGNDRLEAVVRGLRDSAELYRRWYWVLADDHARDIAAEHSRLRDLALARDVDRAVAVLEAHIERAPTQLIAYAQQHGVDQLHRPGLELDTA